MSTMLLPKAHIDFLTGYALRVAVSDGLGIIAPDEQPTRPIRLVTTHSREPQPSPSFITPTDLGRLLSVSNAVAYIVRYADTLDLSEVEQVSEAAKRYVFEPVYLEGMAQDGTLEQRVILACNVLRYQLSGSDTEDPYTAAWLEAIYHHAANALAATSDLDSIFERDESLTL